MPRFIVYQITNNLNGKIYIGVHSTDNLNDSYMGSGKVIKAALKLHGRQNFIKEVLFSFSTCEEAYAKELELVTPEFVAREDTYNLVPGGCTSPIWTKARLEASKLRPRGQKVGFRHTEETRKKLGDHLRSLPHTAEGTAWARKIRKEKQIPSHWKGKEQSESSNRKRSESHLKLDKLQCPHCQKFCDPGNATRWHFDKCKVIIPNELRGSHE
jgi:hypothetical protein